MQRLRPGARFTTSRSPGTTGTRALFGRSSSSQRAGMAQPDKWWSGEDVAVVTGANKGIGFEIAQLLAEAGLRVVVAARSPELGEAAAAKLRALPGLPDPAAVGFLQLNITDAASIQAFRDAVAARFPRGITVLVNNAGFAYKGSVFGADEAATTIGVNYRGTAAVTEALAPLLVPRRGRIVNVSSSSGQLSGIPGPAVRSALEGAASRAELDALADRFVAAIRAGAHAKEGFGNSMYGFSKALETAYTRVVARELEGQGIMVNACCPGWCATDMSSWRGPKSAAAGADTPAWLALLPPPGIAGGAMETGGFWRDRAHAPF